MSKRDRTGRTLKVISNGQAVRALEGPDLEAEESDSWQVTIGTFGGKFPNVATFAIVSFYIGEALFTLPSIAVGPNITRLVVTGRKVIVDLVPNAGDNVSTTTWSVGIAKRGAIVGPESGGIWVSTGQGNALIYNITAPDPPASSVPLFGSGQVKVYAASAICNNFNGAQGLYVLLMDNGTTPGPNFQPIAGGRSSLITPANPNTDFAGEFTPLVANIGLWAALSTTPDLYNAPAAGATFCIDLFLGIQ